LRSNVPIGRFLGLGLGDRVPDAKTVWLYRDALAQAAKVEELFGLFDHCPTGDACIHCPAGDCVTPKACFQHDAICQVSVLVKLDIRPISVDRAVMRWP